MKLGLVYLTLLTGSAFAHPAESWAWGIETGSLTKVGQNCPLTYEIIPKQLVVHSPILFDFWQGDDGDRLVVRNRSALIGESIIEGGEDYCIEFAAAPALEYWFPHQQTALFLAIGGGFGVNHSAKSAGAQDQDLILNWFAQSRLRQQLNVDATLVGGPDFMQHFNGGQTDQNPGINVLGATMGLS